MPTVLSAASPPPGSDLPRAVGAACSDTGSLAALKALRELTVVRACVWADPPAGPQAYPEIPEEGFAHLGWAPADDDAAQCNPVVVVNGEVATGVDGATVAQRLGRIVRVLARESSDVVAVELTPVEFENAGVSVVRVIAPALIPYLAYPSVRYLGSRRLYDAPRRMGFRVLPEGDVNPWPSPLW